MYVITDTVHNGRDAIFADFQERADTGAFVGFYRCQKSCGISHGAGSFTRGRLLTPAHAEQAAAYLISFCCSETFENVRNINLCRHQQVLHESTGGMDGNVAVEPCAEASLMFFIVIY